MMYPVYGDGCNDIYFIYLYENLFYIFRSPFTLFFHKTL
jgi:hypothetical protein